VLPPPRHSQTTLLCGMNPRDCPLTPPLSPPSLWAPLRLSSPVTQLAQEIRRAGASSATTNTSSTNTRELSSSKPVYDYDVTSIVSEMAIFRHKGFKDKAGGSYGGSKSHIPGVGACSLFVCCRWYGCVKSTNHAVLTPQPISPPSYSCHRLSCYQGRAPRVVRIR